MRRRGGGGDGQTDSLRLQEPFWFQGTFCDNQVLDPPLPFVEHSCSQNRISALNRPQTTVFLIRSLWERNPFYKHGY